MTCNGTVRINLMGGYGNQLFIYFNARIFAEKNKLNLVADKPIGPLKINDNIHFGKPPDNIKKYIINDNCYNKVNKERKYEGPGNYFFDGYFQIEDIIYNNLDLLKSWIKYDINKKNILTLHLRLDDFYFPNGRHLIISQDYYIDCIKKYGDDFKDVYIICDSINKAWEKKYINSLKKKIIKLGKNPIYRKQSLLEDYQNIIDSKSIITSNSTFCFWPMILSEAEKVIAFPYFAVDITLPNNVNHWNNNHKLFKHKDKKYISNYEYDKEIVNYFEDMNEYKKCIIYFINLKHDIERNKFMNEQLDNLNICFERTEGINGNNLEKKKIMNIMCDNIFFSRGQMGCYLSHKKCYDNFLKTNYKYLIILEDDVILKKEFLDNINRLFLFLDKNIDIDFVYLSRSHIITKSDLTDSHLKKYSDEFIFSPETCGYGFHSYLLTKDGAKKLLTILHESEKNTFAKNKGIPVDCLDRWKILGERMNIKLNIFSLRNEISYAKNDKSNTELIF